MPGDQIRFEAQVTHKRGNIWKFAGKAYVDGKVTTEAEFAAMVSDTEL